MGNEIKVLINTSTFKSSEEEPVPDMINQLIDLLKVENENLIFKILKPMNGSDKRISKKEFYDIHSFRYFFPKKYQNLSIKGIKPSLEESKLNLIKVIFFVIAQFFSLLKICFSFKPDVIYCHWFLPQVINTYLISKLFRTRFIFTSHGSDVLLLNNLGKLGSKIIKKITESSYKYSAVSNLVLNEINKNININASNKEKFTVIPMGIDDKFFNLKQNPREITDKKKFLFIGRLIDYKGIDILLNALSKYKIYNENFELNILGLGTEETRLRNISNQLGLRNNVNFLGFKDFDEKIKYIENCDFFIVPSKKKSGQIEGGPLTLIEGMSFGKICIVSNSIGFMEYCNEKNSVIFDSGNSDSLYKAILFADNLSDDEKSQMSIEASTLSKNFSFQEIAKKHNDFFFAEELK